MLKKRIGAVVAALIITVVAAACEPGEGSTCDTAHRTTFSISHCSVLVNATQFRARALYYSGVDGYNKQAVDLVWHSQGGQSIAYIPDYEIAHGSYVISGSIDFR